MPFPFIIVFPALIHVAFAPAGNKCRASLIQILFSIRSAGQLMEQMQHNLWLRWSAGRRIDNPVQGKGRPGICPADGLQP